MAQYNNLNLRKIKIALVKKMSFKKKNWVFGAEWNITGISLFIFSLTL